VHLVELPSGNWLYLVCKRILDVVAHGLQRHVDHCFEGVLFAIRWNGLKYAIRLGARCNNESCSDAMTLRATVEDDMPCREVVQ
jgi:hypothetical protein